MCLNTKARENLAKQITCMISTNIALHCTECLIESRVCIKLHKCFLTVYNLKFTIF